MRTEARRSMDAYELNPSDTLPNIPNNLHTIGAACDRWLERRGLGTNIRTWWSSQSRGGKTLVDAAPTAPRPVRRKPERTPEEKAAIKRAEYLRAKERQTAEQKAAKKARTDRWRARNREHLNLYSKKYKAEKMAVMSSEERKAYKKLLSDRANAYYHRKKGKTDAG